MNDLRGNSIPARAASGFATRIAGAVLAVIAFGAAGAFVYETAPNPPPAAAVTNSQLPSPSAPVLPSH